MAKTSKPPHDLDKLLRYNPRTGKLHWLVKCGRGQHRKQPGDEAGTLSYGYISIGINRTRYQAHRLAWYLVTGLWLKPHQGLDHINGVRSDNRWTNLRRATPSENGHNRNNRIRVDNTSGHRGVSWRKDRQKWYVRIEVHGTVQRLGCFTNKADAIAVRRAAEKQQETAHG